MPVKSRKLSLWIALLFAVVLVGGVSAFYYRARAPQDDEHMYVQGETLDYNIPLVATQGGVNTKLTQFEGKVLVLNFWAGWCGPCLKEMPSLYKLHQKYAAKGLVVLGLNMDESPAQGLATLEKVAGKPPYAQYWAFEQAIFLKFPVEGLPLTVVVDRKGSIVYEMPGERDWFDPSAQALIEGLL